MSRRFIGQDDVICWVKLQRVGIGLNCRMVMFGAEKCSSPVALSSSRLISHSSRLSSSASLQLLPPPLVPAWSLLLIFLAISTMYYRRRCVVCFCRSLPASRKKRDLFHHQSRTTLSIEIGSNNHGSISRQASERGSR